GNLEKAMEEWSQSLLADSRCLAAYRELARAYAQKGQGQKAAVLFAKALELAGSDPALKGRVLFETGEAALRQGDPARAIEFLNQAAATDAFHDPAALNLSLGMAYSGTGNFTAALPLLEQAAAS